MQVFEAKPRKRGNSIWITIPKNIIKDEKIALNEIVKIIIYKEKE